MPAPSRPLAVVTGASTGIGYEIARELADAGHDLIVAAEDPGIHDAARRLARHTREVEAVRADLATYDGAETLVHAVRTGRRPVSVLVLNAGVGRAGRFLETDLADTARVIDLDIVSTVHLARRLLPDMADRGAGRVLLTSSVAAELPGPYHAVYNASKAFLDSFGLALRDELSGSGVLVTVLLPGATDTRFFARAGLLGTRLGRTRKDDPALVARQACRALAAGRARVVAGSAATRVGARVLRVLPRRVRAALHRRLARPVHGRSGFSGALLGRAARRRGVTPCRRPDAPPAEASRARRSARRPRH
ncbi:SDR family NAD(P)-dependent oxidoreductase [Streptomyces antimicrobicus]|uniref:SDR family NAD(P)-dependent oxidoreductase n=1 Tax=Streptomyces antimicrobicus TaxID=2883108 RepID=A0ABS8B3Q4_9ACTN|nr:SDR family NAD(P)-dependent oxidoreductase [Streptomyces antimicrobicus]MCB5179211.1 SDR family NAD(P)-dependent oxidoreductase [Streptomyces antimicrobicus]